MIQRGPAIPAVPVGRRRVTLRAMAQPQPRRLLTAELLSIGSELTVGDTRDTNAGELARSLTAMGIRVGRLTALPDELEAVTEAFRGGLARSDLVVSTGGLGPTPDDLTRESIAAACGEAPEVDPDLEAWLRELWRRRGMPFPELNLKQAWRIPSATILANPNGTAPGWLVSRPDGRVVVALPGPPREMRPMWADEAIPRLRALGIGAEVASRTYRLTGIGESQVADLLGGAAPSRDQPGRGHLRSGRGRRRPHLSDGLAPAPRRAPGRRGGRDRSRGGGLVRLGDRRDDLERGDRRPTGRARLDAGCRGDRDRWEPRCAARRRALVPLRRDHRPGGSGRPRARRKRPTPRTMDGGQPPGRPGHRARPGSAPVRAPCAELGGAEVGVAVRTRPRTGDTAVSIAVSTPTERAPGPPARLPDRSDGPIAGGPWRSPPSCSRRCERRRPMPDRYWTTCGRRPRSCSLAWPSR